MFLVLAIFVGAPALMILFVFAVDAGSWAALVDDFGWSFAGGLLIGLGCAGYFAMKGQIRSSRANNARPWLSRLLPYVVSVSLLVTTVFSSEAVLAIVMFISGFALAIAPFAVYSQATADTLK
ncbi:MAG TPA: hypothetical protein VF178_16555 [Gemmatimonadaceae bacterium]